MGLMMLMFSNVPLKSGEILVSKFMVVMFLSHVVVQCGDTT